MPNQTLPAAQRRLFTIPEAGSYIGVSNSKIYSLLGENKIASVKIDGGRRVTRESLDAYVDGLSVTAA